MAQNTTRGAHGAPRRQQPRRRSSQQHNRERSSIDAHRARAIAQVDETEEDVDAMQVDERPALSPQEAMRAAHPLREMADRIGREVEEFAEKLDAWKPKHWGASSAERKSAFELVKEYRSLADNTVSRLFGDHAESHHRQLKRGWRERLDPSALSDDDASSSDDDGVETSLDDLRAWQAELNTWRLLEELSPLAYPGSRSRTPDKEDDGVRDWGDDRFIADGDSWTDFLAADEVARNRHLVLKWLEESAERVYGEAVMVDLIEEEMKYCSERGDALFSKGWIDTRERIKAKKISEPWNVDTDDLPNIEGSDGQLVIQQLDPDAPVRTQRVVEVADRTFEHSIWVLCWEMMRCGISMTKVRDWCEEHNEIARGVTLGAYAVPYYGNGDQRKYVVSRYRWRKACQAAATRSKNEYERAVLGLISGEYGFLESIAETWEDLCFARYNTLLLAQYRVYLRQAYPNALPHEHMYSFGETESLDVCQTPAEILRSIRTHPVVRDARQNAQATIQQSIVAGDVADLLFRQGVLLARKSRAKHQSMLISPEKGKMLPEEEHILNLTSDVDGLRVLAHCFMILQFLGLEFESLEHREAAENVFLAYIEFLLLAGKDKLIPVYAAKLPTGEAVWTLGRVLPFITDKHTRVEYMIFMKDYGIPAVLALRAQFENTKRQVMEDVKNLPAFSSYENLDKVLEHNDIWPGVRVRAAKATLTASETQLLQSLEWYDLLDGFWYQSFEVLTEAAVLFLENGRVQAAADLFETLPAHAISMSKSGAALGMRLDIIDDDDVGIDVNLPNEPYGRRSRRRRSSSGSKRQRPSDEQKSKRSAMKLQAMCYYELNLLVDAIRAMWSWREAEDLYLSNNPQSQRTTHLQVQEAHEAVDSALVNVMSSMDLVLTKDFLTTPPPPNYTQPLNLAQGQSDDSASEGGLAARLRKIREAYLPSLVIAYNAILHSAGHVVGRDHFLTSVELADVVADDDELTRCFVQQGRMRELVTQLALTSKAMLKLNELKPNASKRRGKGPRTLAIWDISV